MTVPLEPASSIDLARIAAGLGRAPRDVVGIAARCVCGAPIVVATRPRLSDGTPFPTFYYLITPAATQALSTLEASGVMSTLNERLASDSSFADSYRRAHYAYLNDRAEHGEVGEIAGYSAGGMPDRVKCLHALAAHALAAGPGVNPAGDAALMLCRWSPKHCQCEPVMDSGS